MWVTDLACEAGHGFEGFFPSREAFDAQRERGLVQCPSCGSAQVAARLNAPRLNLGADPVPEVKLAPSTPVQGPASLRELVTRLKAGSEDQGRQFPAEARAIHEGRAAPRSIHGQASAEELFELLDEGIAVLPLPDIEALEPPH